MKAGSAGTCSNAPGALVANLLAILVLKHSLIFGMYLFVYLFITNAVLRKMSKIINIF